MKKQLKPLSVTLERDQVKALRHIAVDQDVSPSVIVRDAIGEYLARQKTGSHVSDERLGGHAEGNGS
jgi:predicted transcriptional regulator